ncbi:MAG: fumarylacetoacetate hydrolase family protein [bacterium]|nr:fumarylacetoacetate hydrolase family protein [bacterium]MDE0644543.1 fumarylacetoacetate hydrolase family protein [bacterium]MYD04491.1 fumarylacetoacetate hydrolase family protein [Acidimicrobiia bacterium]MYH54846.1 fumarylacetoacetate hydrolase family protein [Acidimicrobiia bacterium]
MKIVRMQTAEGIRYGAVEPEGIRIHDGTPFVAWQPTEVVVDFREARLLSPVFPTKVIGVVGNYSSEFDPDAGVAESPNLFIKPSTSVIGPGAAIVLPALSHQVRHGAALAVVIGKVARRIAFEDASSVVLGYTAGNDITANDLLQEDGSPSRAKGFDSFCPLGPAIETEYDPLEDFSLECRVNASLRQGSTINDMIFGVAELVSYITSVMTLLPGDVILTGTPAGAGPIRNGEVVEVSLEGVGTLSNPVVAE